MSAAESLIPELEDVVQHGSPQRRTEMLRRVTTLFLTGADRFSDDHIKLFDEVIGYLIEEIEARALAELARRIAPIANAPHDVVHTLARSDDITVAGPVLQQARLDDPDLRLIAETKGQAHLLAISMRNSISEALADILVERGDRDVVHNVADNHRARLSENALMRLVARAENDDALAERIGSRTDIPPRLFRQLLMQATEAVQERLLARARADTKVEIRKILAKVSQEVGAKAAPHSFARAMHAVQVLHNARKLTEADVVDFAKDGKYDETIAALALLCAVPVEVVDRLMTGERYDPMLILARSLNFSWDTTRAIITARPGARGTSTPAIEAAKENYDKLTAATAQRVVRFWQLRPAAGA
jgi:uncharacterized protein (DUF2336 family)